MDLFYILAKLKSSELTVVWRWVIRTARAFLDLMAPGSLIQLPLGVLDIPPRKVWFLWVLLLSLESALL